MHVMYFDIIAIICSARKQLANLYGWYACYCMCIHVVQPILSYHR